MALGRPPVAHIYNNLGPDNHGFWVEKHQYSLFSILVLRWLVSWKFCIHSNSLCWTLPLHSSWLWKKAKGEGVDAFICICHFLFALGTLDFQASLSMNCLLKSGAGFCRPVSPRVVWAQKGRWGWDWGGVRHLQNPTTVTKAYPGSAPTCQTVNKAPGRARASWTPWSNTKQTTTRCACRTDSPSASCQAENVYPICQDNLSSNKPWACSLEQPEFCRYNVTLFFSPIFL